MWWLYVPMRFDDFMLCLIIQEEPDGYRALNDCHRVWKDGRVEQLGWPHVQVRYASGTRVPTGATITCTTPDGKPLEIEVESKLAVPLHVGGGYGGDSDWTHGVWKGADFTERVTYDITAPDVAGRVMFGVIDHVGRAVCEARRAGASSSTAPSAATTPAASPTGSPSPRDHHRNQEIRMSLDRDTLFIDGGWAAPATTRTIEVISPHTEQVVATVPEGTIGDIDAAVAAARHAFDHGPWPRMTPAERIDVVAAFSGLYAGKMAEMADAHHHRDGLAHVVRQPRSVAGALDADRGVPGHRSRVPLGGDPPGRARLTGDGAPRARRGGRRHPAVERPAVHDHVEGDPGAARRLHRRRQAGAGDPARRLPDGRAAHRGRCAGRRGQHRRRRPRGRRAPRRAPGHRQGRLHRLHRCGPQDRSGLRRAAQAGLASSSAASRRRSCSTTPT